MSKLRFAAVLAAAVLAPPPEALAQAQYPSTIGGNAFLQVMGCLNSLGKAVAANSVDCAGNPWGGGAGGGSVTQGTVPWVVALVASALGGASSYHVIASAGDNHTVIKNGAGTVYDVDAENDGTAIQYIRLYDAGTGFNGCNSATGLVWGSPIPAASAAAGVGGGIVKAVPVGRLFANGISICVTGAVSDTDTTAAAVTTIVNVGYK